MKLLLLKFSCLLSICGTGISLAPNVFLSLLKAKGGLLYDCLLKTSLVGLKFELLFWTLKLNKGFLILIPAF